MNVGSFIGIYMPFFILLFIIFPQQKAAFKAIRLRAKRKGEWHGVTNELINKYIGKKCMISTGTFGTNVKGMITAVKENWIEIETSKGQELINAEFIQSIKIL